MNKYTVAFDVRRARQGQALALLDGTGHQIAVAKCRCTGRSGPLPPFAVQRGTGPKDGPGRATQEAKADGSMDGPGRATQDAKAEGRGGGVNMERE